MTFITKKHISRRTLLQGLGVTMSLPLLDSMVPAQTPLARTAATPQMRLGLCFIPHGAVMNNWTPAEEGALTLSRTLAPLEPYKNQVVVVSNLAHKMAAPGGPGDNGGDHTRSPSVFLNGVHPKRTDGADILAGVTIDQMAAQKIGQDTPLPSLEVSAETIVQAAAGSGGSYTTLSFRDAESPLPMESNPRKVFLQLFGEGDTPPERVSIRRQTNSILDLILDRTKQLQGELGNSDRSLLEGYLESVREIERRTQKAASKDLSALKIPEAPIGELDSFPDQVKLMFDLIALAYQADLTRVASYIMVAEGTNRTYNHIGVPDSFHPVSHHANDMERLNKLVKIQSWHVEKFAEFLAKLAATPDGPGTLLDHSILMYGSNMSNSDLHNNYPEPNIVVGGGNGKMKLGGQHIALPERTPIANLHLTLLQKVGVERDKFGDSTGTIAEI